ncbi:molybdopterin-dependent oxidoreductase [Dactylosporangium sp. NPDC049525]|uniref:molybdopterin-dependent oxidoreductase n=1 Tax=Dactylosporangium sp. NPDC049525 TaxID=3154730 RepID=UPI003431F097
MILLKIRAACSGVLAAAAGIAIGELFAALVVPAAGPVVGVGGVIIDATPTPVKEWAVRTFGTNDKPLLLTGIAAGLVVFAAVVGVLGQRRRVFGLAGAALLGLAGAAAAASRPAAGPLDGLPSLLGGAVAAGALLLLLRTLAPSGSAVVAGAVADDAVIEDAVVDSAVVDGGAGRPARLLDRRGFIGTAAIIGAGAAVAGGGAAALHAAGRNAADRSREAVRLPAPTSAAPPLPAGLDPGFVTTNRDFYRVDTALTVPRVDVSSWRLRIKGMVGRPLELSFDDLLRRPLIERDITLNCVSNEVGGPYVGTARWLGVSLADLLREVRPAAGADQLVARSVDGMTIGTPLSVVLDGRDAMLCVGMNGEPLPLDHGFPVRMLTPGLYGYAGACKWVTELELTTFDAYDAYWVQRGWAARGPVKTASRIDRPLPFARPAAGTVHVAGVAWAQGRGVASVEVQVDDGPWQAATLLPAPTNDTWVQWRLDWAATPGSHLLRVRATDKTGAVQTADRVTPFPDGATGWHSVTVTAV